MKLSIDTSKTYQTMEGFGASGAWWAQTVGDWTSVQPDGVPTKDRIAELLYSRKNGIGMSIYRYNLGSGSAESGRGSYSDPARRAHSFLTADGYDFSKDAAAVTMLRKCVQAGADEVVFFVNSPIESLTKNGCGHSDKKRAFCSNLPTRNIPAFCRYCLDVTEHFVKEGLPVRFLSPINEPVWKWTGGQEGCHYSPRQASKVFSRFAREMQKRPALSGVKLSGAENGDIRWYNKSFTRVLMKKSVRQMTDGVDVHSYFLHPSSLPFLSRTAYLKRYRRWLDRHYPSVKVRCSEWTHMQGGKNTGMDSALTMANVMFEDLSILNVCSWQHWIACSLYDYCDGLLYIDNEKETFELTKRYFVTGNFSRFIQRGAVRTACETDDEDVRALHFLYKNQSTVLLINNSEKEKTLSLGGKAEAYITDERNDLRPVSAQGKLTLPPKSVVTLVSEGGLTA